MGRVCVLFACVVPARFVLSNRIVCHSSAEIAAMRHFLSIAEAEKPRNHPFFSPRNPLCTFTRERLLQFELQIRVDFPLVGDDGAERLMLRVQFLLQLLLPRGGVHR